MKKSDFVIVGGVAAGPKTAATLARRLPDTHITLFQRDREVSYGTCGMPYFASGDINSFEELTFTSYGIPRDPDFFKKTKNFDVTTGAEVIGIDREKKTVTVRMLDSCQTVEHGYGKLVLATGASPNPPPFPIPDSPRIRYFTRPDDAIAFRQMAQEGKISKALVVGGGFIGCEVAEAAGGLWGINVSLVEKEACLLPKILDPEMAEIVRRELARNDVEVITGTEIEKIELDSEDNPVAHIKGKDTIAADYVFLCLGVHPNVTLARKCGLDIGPTGGIKVNSRMQTSDPDIFAGGDCVENSHLVTGKPCYIPMGSLANRHGRVIAENLAGTESSFPGVTGAFLVKVFETNCGAVGISETVARQQGLRPRVVWGTFPDRPDYYPEVQTFVLKMVYNSEDNRLVGLQAVGAGDICRRIDVFSTFLMRQAAVADLLDFEQGYAPPYAEALDPLHHLAAVAQAQQKGASFVSPAEDLNALDSVVQIIDVREKNECESSPWPGLKETVKPVNIPLNDLRKRLNELDKNRKVVIICKRGLRSYQAALILKAAGFDSVDILAAGLQSQL